MFDEISIRNNLNYLEIRQFVISLRGIGLNGKAFEIGLLGVVAISAAAIFSRSHNRGLLVFASYAILSSLLTGCGLSNAQRDAITTFTPAGSGLGDILSKQFVGARDSVIELNTCLLTLSPDLVPIKAQLPRAFDRDHLDDALSSKRIGEYVKAADLIKTYSDAIDALINDTQQIELSDASKELTAAIRSYDSKKTLINDDGLTAIGSAIVVGDSLLVEHKKLKSLKEIVPRINKVITDISNVISNDMIVHNPDQILNREVKGGVFDTVNLTALKVTAAADHVLNAPKSSLSDRQISIGCRNKAIKALDNVSAISEKLHESVLGVAKAHSQMAIKLEDDSIDIGDIKLFAVKLKDLQPVLKAVSGNGLKVHL